MTGILTPSLSVVDEEEIRTHSGDHELDSA
jgi:hypothetical protein